MFAGSFDRVDHRLTRVIAQARKSLCLATPNLDPSLARMISDSLPRSRQNLIIRVLVPPPSPASASGRSTFRALKSLESRNAAIRLLDRVSSSLLLIDGDTLILAGMLSSESTAGQFGCILKGLDIVGEAAALFNTWWESAAEFDREALETLFQGASRLEELAANINRNAGILTINIRLFPRIRLIKPRGKIPGISASEESAGLRLLYRPFIHHLPHFASLEVYRQKAHGEKKRLTLSTSLGFIIPFYRLPAWEDFFRALRSTFKQDLKKLIDARYEDLKTEGRNRLEKYLDSLYERKLVSDKSRLFSEDRRSWVNGILDRFMTDYPKPSALARDYAFNYRINGIHPLSLGDDAVRKELKPLLDDLAQRDLPL